MPSHEALASYVKDRKAFADSEHRHEAQRKWAEALLIYKNYIDKAYPSKAKLHVPVTFATTFRLYSAIMSNLRQNRDIAQYIPYPKTADAATVAAEDGERMQRVSEYFVSKARALRQVAAWELEAVTCGTSFIKTTWQYETEEEFNPETGEAARKVIYDGLRFEHRPAKSIYFDPKVLNKQATVDDMEYLIDERYVSFDWIANNGNFINKGDVRAKMFANRGKEDKLDDQVDQAYDMTMDFGVSGVENRDKQSDMILLDEFYGRVPRDLLFGDRKKNWGPTDLKDFVDAHVILAEGVVIYADFNPYPHGRIPYDVIRGYLVPGFFYGIGVPELIKDLQRVMNAIVNQRIDNVGLVLNRMWVFKQNQVNPKHLISRAGGAIPVTGDVNTALKEIITPDVTNSSYNEQQIMDTFIQKFSGVSDIFFGQSASQTKLTATEVTLQTEMGAGIMEEILAGQVQDGFVPMMEKVRDYIQAFMAQPVPANVGGQMQMVIPAQVSGEYELVPTIGERMFTKTAELQKAVFLLQTTLSLDQQLRMEGRTPKYSDILERVYEFAGWKNYSTYVPGGPGAAQGQAAGGQEIQPGVVGGGEGTSPGVSGGAGGGTDIAETFAGLFTQ